MYGIGSERTRQRGTLAHATVVIDNENSSEVWSGFRVARRAKVFKVKNLIQDKKTYLSASHDGYKDYQENLFILDNGFFQAVYRSY